MSTWTQIQTTNVPRALLPSNVHSGPFEIGGALYALLNRDPIAGPYTNRMYKSTDSGATWAEVDGANRPTGVFHSTAYYPGSGTVVYYAYFDVTLQTLRIKNFDTATDTWQVEVGGGPAVGLMLYMTVLASGDYVFEFGVFNGLILDCYYVIYSGGWGAPTLISSDPTQSSTPAGIVLDAADLVHFFYVLKNDLELRHAGLPSGGPLGADQLVASVQAQYSVGVGVIWNSKVVFSFADGSSNPAVAYGTPAGSATPVWATEVADAGKTINTALVEDHYLFLVVKGAGLNYFWIDDINALPPGTLNTLYLSVNSGAGFAAASAYYTDSMFCPADYLHNPDITLKGDGRFGVLVDRILAVIVGEHGSQTGYLYDPLATLTVTKVLAPSSDPGLFDLQIDGSTEATDQGNGGTTGPIPVTVGAHTVGEVAGTGTSLADYTVSIGGDAAPDGSITLAAGESKTATITNVRRPITPSAPPYPWPPSPSGTCRKTTLHLWQAARAPQVEISTDRKSDWTECGDSRNKYFQGLLLDCDTYNVAKDVQVRDSDTGALHVLQPALVKHSGRQRLAYSFVTPFLAHQVRDEPQDAVAWRRFGITYVWEPSPESVQTWKTQRTAHGLKGYQHIPRIEAAYESTAPVTLALTAYDGTSPAPLTLPATGGVYQKLLLTLTPNKGQLYDYAATSQAPFRLFLNDWTVWIGEWGRPGPYLAYRNLGGEFGDKASI